MSYRLKDEVVPRASTRVALHVVHCACHLSSLMTVKLRYPNSIILGTLFIAIFINNLTVETGVGEGGVMLISKMMQQQSNAVAEAVVALSSFKFQAQAYSSQPHSKTRFLEAAALMVRSIVMSREVSRSLETRDLLAETETFWSRPRPRPRP